MRVPTFGKPYPLARLEAISFHSRRGGAPDRFGTRRAPYVRPSQTASSARLGPASEVAMW